MLVAWLLLVAAIIVEVSATAALPRTASFHHPGWTAVVLGGYAVSIWLLSVVVRQIPVSVAYAVWSGLGTAGIVAVGVLVLGEQLDWVRGLALLMVVGGVTVLNLHGAH
ncbi:MAG: multidrug efflux SMR transporter [Nocardioidaceae bacterium]